MQDGSGVYTLSAIAAGVTTATMINPVWVRLAHPHPHPHPRPHSHSTFRSCSRTLSFPSSLTLTEPETLCFAHRALNHNTEAGSLHQVVKTRVQLQKQSAYGGSENGVVYKNSLDAAVRIWKEEGPRAFFKGLVPRCELSACPILLRDAYLRIPCSSPSISFLFLFLSCSLVFGVFPCDPPPLPFMLSPHLFESRASEHSACHRPATTVDKYPDDL
jgi:hypothetical protein